MDKFKPALNDTWITHTQMETYIYIYIYIYTKKIISKKLLVKSNYQ